MNHLISWNLIILHWILVWWHWSKDNFRLAIQLNSDWWSGIGIHCFLALCITTRPSVALLWALNSQNPCIWRKRGPIMSLASCCSAPPKMWTKYWGRRRRSCCCSMKMRRTVRNLVLFSKRWSAFHLVERKIQRRLLMSTLLWYEYFQMKKKSNSTEF